MIFDKREIWLGTILDVKNSSMKRLYSSNQVPFSVSHTAN